MRCHLCRQELYGAPQHRSLNACLVAALEREEVLKAAIAERDELRRQLLREVTARVPRTAEDGGTVSAMVETG